MLHLAQGSTRESADFVAVPGACGLKAGAGANPIVRSGRRAAALEAPGAGQRGRSRTPLRRLPSVLSARRTRAVSCLPSRVPLPPLGSGYASCYHRLGWSRIKQRGLARQARRPLPTIWILWDFRPGPALAAVFRGGRNYGYYPSTPGIRCRGWGPRQEQRRATRAPAISGGWQPRRRSQGLELRASAPGNARHNNKQPGKECFRCSF